MDGGRERWDLERGERKGGTVPEAEAERHGKVGQFILWNKTGVWSQSSCGIGILASLHPSNCFWLSPGPFFFS